MIRVLIVNNNKVIIETKKKTKIEKKEYAKKDRYIFTTQKKRYSVPRKRISEYYQKKFRR